MSLLRASCSCSRGGGLRTGRWRAHDIVELGEWGVCTSLPLASQLSAITAPQWAGEADPLCKHCLSELAQGPELCVAALPGRGLLGAPHRKTCPPAASPHPPHLQLGHIAPYGSLAVAPGAAAAALFLPA